MTYQEFCDNLNTDIITLDGELFDAVRGEQQVFYRMSISYTFQTTMNSLTKDDVLGAAHKFWQMLQDGRGDE